MKEIPSDIGSKKARLVLEECGLINDPIALSCEDIAYSRGVTDVKALNIDGSQGRIMIYGNEAVISYDKKIYNKGKRRFVIAHEIGHFELHRELLNNQIHNDDIKTLSEWYAKGPHENQANKFAAELLMPSHLFLEKVSGKIFNLDLIKSVADFFQTSITSTLIKYLALGDFPIAIIYCNDGKVEWSSFSNDFLLQYVPKGMDVPENSVAVDFYYGDNLPNEPEPVEALDWFLYDFNVKKHKEVGFYEQCIQVSDRAILSCIWND